MESFLGGLAGFGGAAGGGPGGGGPVVLPSDGADVCVVGSSGNVGKLVVLRLVDEGYGVRAVVRSQASGERLAAFLGERASKVRIVEADVTASDASSQLGPAMAGAGACVVCTGTTAFPTKAWANDGTSPDDINSVVWRALTASSFDLKKAVSALSAQGLNTPERVDALRRVEALCAERGDGLLQVEGRRR